MPEMADKALEGLLAEGVSSYDVIDALKGVGFSVEGPAEEASEEESDDEMSGEVAPAFGPAANERAYDAIMKGGK